MTSEDDQSRVARFISNPPALFGAVVVLWLLWFAADLAFYLLGWSFETAGQFGDWFGGINALFTALAFAAVTWSAFMQRQEMRNQQQEMRNQQREMQAQQAVLELQRQEMALARDVSVRQSFESRFFRMLDQHRQSHESIAYHFESGRVDRGHAAMATFAHECSEILEFRQDIEDPSECRGAIGDGYDTDIYSRHENALGPYFRTLYHLFKLIDTHHFFRESESRAYSNIARAQLSANDLLVLAVNGCSEEGAGFRPYIERFGLLKHLRLEDYDHFRTIERCYSPAAFQGLEDAVLEPYLSSESSQNLLSRDMATERQPSARFVAILDRINGAKSFERESAQKDACELVRLLSDLVEPCLVDAANALRARGCIADVLSDKDGNVLRLKIGSDDAGQATAASVLLFEPATFGRMVKTSEMLGGDSGRITTTESSRELFTRDFVAGKVEDFLERALR